jgi:hypothetical protein
MPTKGPGVTMSDLLSGKLARSEDRSAVQLEKLAR